MLSNARHSILETSCISGGEDCLAHSVALVCLLPVFLLDSQASCESIRIALVILAFPFKYYLQSRAKNNRPYLLSSFVCLMETRHPLTAASEPPRNTSSINDIYSRYRNNRFAF